MPQAKDSTGTQGEKPATRSPRRRRNRAEPIIPLGSLTQQARSSSPSCVACGSYRVTSLALQLTDGTPVQFTSCQWCEHRRWEHNGQELSREEVLSRTRKR